MAYDLDKMNKLPPGYRFLDTNEWWYFANRWVVRWLAPMPAVSPNHITFLTLVMGVLAGGYYLSFSENALYWAAFFLYGKLLFDNVDGNLARVRGEESRLGRFFDSFTDFFVATLIYACITWRVVRETGQPGYFLLGGAAWMSAQVQCSYFVFYLVNFTSHAGSYGMNRVDETITDGDKKNLESGQVSRLEYFLQKLHVLFYGWQDRCVEKLDAVTAHRAALTPSRESREAWYMDKWFMTLCSPLCLCTNIMMTVVFTLAGALQELLWAVCLANLYLLGLQIWKMRQFRRREAGC